MVQKRKQNLHLPHHIADGVPAILGELGLEMRAQAEGLTQERLQVPPIPQGLAGRGQLELEGEADGAHKAIERPGALITCEATALARTPRTPRPRSPRARTR